jgi:thioredoxin:protein disulfide reductase
VVLPQIFVLIVENKICGVRMKFKKVFKLITVSLFLLETISFAQPQLVTIKLEKNNLKVNTGTELKIILHASVQSGWHINSNKPNDEFLIPTVIKSKNKSFPLSNVAYPKAEERKLAVSDKPVSVFENEIKVELSIKIDKSTAAGKYVIPIEFSYQGCNDQTCMPPSEVVENLNIEITAAAKTETPVIKNEIQDAKSETEKIKDASIDAAKQPVDQNTQQSGVTEKKENADSSSFEERGLLLSLLIVFLGGLALNLTPCVYPLIPITIGYFGGQTEGRTSKLFLLGLFYVLGIALTYSIVGVVTALSGAMFGALLQQPIVIAFICLIFIALALSMFGVYEFKLPDSWTAKAGGARSGVFGAFFMGLTMGIVAAPCIGPFVLSLVTVVAAKGDAVYGFIMFFVLALGLGFPYLILALFSGKIKSLPRAGLWMEAVKHIFGFIMVGMAIYYAGPLIPKSVNHYLLPVYGILVAVFLLFFDKTASANKGFKTFKTVFSIVIVAVAVYALWPVKENSLTWQKYDQTAFANAKSKNEKIIIDFSAEWCVPCKELDAQTFSNEKVIDAGKDFTAFKADMTKTGSEEIEKLRKDFNVIGVPTVLIFDSKGNEVERLTGFINAEGFLKLMEKAK